MTDLNKAASELVVNCKALSVAAQGFRARVQNDRDAEIDRLQGIVSDLSCSLLQRAFAARLIQRLA